MYKRPSGPIRYVTEHTWLGALLLCDLALISLAVYFDITGLTAEAGITGVLAIFLSVLIVALALLLRWIQT